MKKVSSRNILLCLSAALLFLFTGCLKVDVVGPVNMTDIPLEPTFTPGFTAIADTQTLDVRLSSESLFANINYTTDGSIPTASNGILYSNSNTIGVYLSPAIPTKTIKAVAWYGTDLKISKVSSITYTLTNLIGKWTFGEGSGNTVADTSGHSNHGTLFNSYAWVSSPMGFALSSGTNGGHFNCGVAPSLNLTNNFTLSAWINCSNVLTAKGSILGKEYINQTGYRLYINTSKLLELRVCGNSTSSSAFSSTAVGTGWTHIAVTYKNRQVTFYINGLAAGTQTTSIDIAAPVGQAFTIHSGYGPESMKGAVDNVRIYNAALDFSQIKLLHQLSL